jgi:hypothetical protein
MAETTTNPTAKRWLAAAYHAVLTLGNVKYSKIPPDLMLTLAKAVCLTKPKSQNVKDMRYFKTYTKAKEKWLISSLV